MKRMTILIITLGFLMGCATNGQVTHSQFMERAQTFDKKHMGQEYTQPYRACYGQYFNDLYGNCAPLVTDGDMRPYWTCCDGALDAFEDCMGEERT